MDRLLTLRNDITKEKEVLQVKENILKLIDIYYEALDAPKKGGGKVSSVFLPLTNVSSRDRTLYLFGCVLTQTTGLTF